MLRMVSILDKAFDSVLLIGEFDVRNNFSVRQDVRDFLLESIGVPFWESFEYVFRFSVNLDNINHIGESPSSLELNFFVLYSREAL